MNRFQRDFIEIIRAAFEPTSYELSSDFDFERAVQLAKAHNIAAIVYYGALNCGVDSEHPQMQELFSLTCKAMMVSQRQMYEIGRLEAAFEEAGIAYMPLKGTILKGLYPRPEMRAMGDADILIKLEQYSKIEEIMRSLEFEFDSECDHVFEWHKPSLHLELHKKVVPENDEDLYGYFETGWKFADQIQGTHQFEMSWENFFLYIFVHFTKHYRIAGIGIKHILDLWVVTHTHPNPDMEYIHGELKKMGLHEFYTNVMKVVTVWFLNGSENEKTELITNVIFNSGQYGTYEQQIVNRAVLTHKGSSVKARFVKLRDGIFLPYRKMKIRYKAVEKCPILLPVMWVVRWFEILLFRRHVFKVQRERSKMMDKKNMEDHKQALQFVGLYTDR